MTIDFSPFPLLLGLLALLIFLVRLRQKHKPLFLIMFSLFWLYILLVVAVVLFPLRVPDDWPGGMTSRNTLDYLNRVNLIPFYYGDLFSASKGIILWELAGNILLTMPFGFALPFLLPVSPRRMLWLAMLPGLTLELMQLFIPLLGLISGYGHSVDINDVLVNAFGALIGYSLFRLLLKLRKLFIT